MLLKTFVRDRAGATAIEYGLISSLIAVAIIAALDSLGIDLGALFGTISAALA
jgi:pilus assembly protein Flp/PilA